MTTSGLGATDLGAERALGGLAKQFYDKLAKYYNVEKCTRFEPHVAEKIFQKWLSELEIDVQKEQFIASVYKEDGVIQQVTMTEAEGSKQRAVYKYSCS